MQSVVFRRRPGLSEKRDECWFLMTNQPGTASGLRDLYDRQTAVEHLFRDDKDKRNGWSLRETKVTRPDRRVCRGEILAEKRYTAVGMVFDERDSEISDFTIGLTRPD